MTLHPLPTKTRTSFDIPRLLASLTDGKTLHTNARFEDLLVVRNWMSRHHTPMALTQTKIEGGYIIGLKERAQ